MLEHAHVRHGHEHVRPLVEDGDVAAGGHTRQGYALRHVQPRRGALAAHEVAEQVVAQRADHAGLHAQPREVFHHVARHASGAGAQVAGVGVAHDDGRTAHTVDVHIGRAYTKHIHRKCPPILCPYILYIIYSRRRQVKAST